MKLIQSTKASARGDYATTACGKTLYNRGKCIVKGTVDGDEFCVPFKDMDVELPILSVRKIVKRRNSVRFNQRGGTIKCLDTGRILKFYEHEGVYFIKLKVTDPAIDPQQLGFARPGTP